MYIKIRHFYILQMKSKKKNADNLMCFVTNKTKKKLDIFT